LSQGNILAQDEIHYLFPNLNKLLNFQRKFLIKLESTAELPWQEQRWGSHFIQSVSVCGYPPLFSNRLPICFLFFLYKSNSFHLLNSLFHDPGLEQKEDEFVVYEPYCANYTAAADLMLANEQNLAVRSISARLSSGSSALPTPSQLCFSA
jgi:cell division control protein 24